VRESLEVTRLLRVFEALERMPRRSPLLDDLPEVELDGLARPVVIDTAMRPG
jgi:hypothetical protein